MLQVRNEFYRDSQGAVLVFDVCDRISFESLDSWVQEMNAEFGDKTECDNIVVCVCANKVSCDTCLKGLLWNYFRLSNI